MGSSSYPIEIGVVTFLSQRYCRLIKPQADWQYWSTENQQLHGISRDLLNERGLSAQQVCSELNELLIGQTVYSDSWETDNLWLTKLFDSAEMEMKFSLAPLEKIRTEQQMAIWRDTHESVCANTKNERLRASNDAVLIQNVFLQTQHLLNSPISL